MLNLKTAEKLRTSFIALGLLGLVVLGCKSLPGAKMNMFEATNAQDGATKLKTKLGTDSVKVSRISIHEDQESIVIQDPAKPKNFDEYTYSNGLVTGPKPVEALVIGNQEFTADKSRLFNLDDINLGAVPEVCRNAMQRAQIENGKPENISIDWQSIALTQTKEEKEKLFNASKK